jgi:hypothetical protein
LDLKSDDRFHPADPVSRLEAARSLVRLASMMGFDGEKSNLIAPKDFESIPKNDRPIVMATLGQGLFQLDEQRRFQAATSLKREELAHAVFRILIFPWRLERN